MPLLFFGLITGLIAAFVASNKGRSTLGWFLTCFFAGFIPPLGIICLVVLLASSNLSQEQMRHAQEAAWRRRHSDVFNQEQAVNKNFRDHVIKRLDRQDEALGLPPVTDRPVDAPPTPKEITTYPMMGDGNWYLVVDGQERGPLAESEVAAMLKRGEISPSTYAWSEGMKDWVRAYAIGNFANYC